MTGANGRTEDQLGTGSSSAWYGEIDIYKYPDDPTLKWDHCVDWTKVGHFSQVKTSKKWTLWKK